MSWENDEDHPLYEHTKKESGLTKTHYEQYSQGAECDEDTVAYRGFWFRTKESFDAFKKILDNKEYYPKFPESFTRNWKTAESFAIQKKTFFPMLDNNIFIENNYRKATNEYVAGYAGIILKTVIPKGKGLDLSKTRFSVEDEIIYMTDKKMDYSYEILDSFENQLKKNPIDINEHIRNHDLKNPLTEYLFANHADEIDNETQHHILNEIIKPYDIKNDKNLFLVDEDKRLIIGEESKRSLHNEDVEINLYTKPLFTYYEYGIFKDEDVMDRIKKFSNHVVHEACEFIETEYLYRDESLDYQIVYKMNNIKDYTYFADEFAKERYSQSVHFTHPKSYQELNDSFRTTQERKDLTQQEIQDKIKGLTNSITDLMATKYDSMISDERIEKDLNEKKERKNEAIKKGRSLKNR